MKRTHVLVLIAGFLAIFLIWSAFGSRSSVTFVTTQVTRGNIDSTISASGTVEPEEVIDVGAQVAGQIVEFGKDIDGQVIDYGSKVSKGQLLARIDETVYNSNLLEAQAQLKQTQAQLEQAKAENAQAEKNWNRAQKVGPSQALSPTSFDNYKALFEIGRAKVLVAEAQVTQAQASVDRAQRNLDFCKITSPVDGIIIDRKVNIGQTVVASFNTPSLFLIAKDLSKMQVWVSVNEADIGQIHPKQRVRFTVDALPDETFEGSVRKIRLNASMTQNVVTYVVEVSTDNSNNRLLPYLTANVRFEIARAEDTFLVSNAALRFNPPQKLIGTSLAATSDTKNKTEGQSILWSERDGRLNPIPVTTSVTDGSITAISGTSLEDGLTVVTGVVDSEAKAGVKTVTNPLMPQMPRRGNR